MASTYTAPAFTPLIHHDGYPPLEDLGLIGGGTTIAAAAVSASPLSR